MSDLRAALGAQRLEGEQRRHRHRWFRSAIVADGIISPKVTPMSEFCSCGAIKDEAKSRRGRLAGKRGRTREKYVEHKYGPRKVGQFGDAIDNVGATFKWQSKTTTDAPPKWLWGLCLSGIAGIRAAKWFTKPMEHMAGLREDLDPLVVKSWTKRGWSQDVIVVEASVWFLMHGAYQGVPTPTDDYVVMTGEHFLDVHGRDEGRRPWTDSPDER